MGAPLPYCATTLLVGTIKVIPPAPQGQHFFHANLMPVPVPTKPVCPRLYVTYFLLHGEKVAPCQIVSRRRTGSRDFHRPRPKRWRRSNGVRFSGGSAVRIAEFRPPAAVHLTETAAGRPLPGCGDPLVQAEHPESQKAEERHHQDGRVPACKEVGAVHGMLPSREMRSESSHPADGLIGPELELP
jgi:hypothetical protein